MSTMIYLAQSYESIKRPGAFNACLGVPEGIFNDMYANTEVTVPD